MNRLFLFLFPVVACAAPLSEHMAFTRRWEGLALKPYRDNGGYSIGVGHHFPKGTTAPKVWTRAQAERAFMVDMSNAIQIARRTFNNYDSLSNKVQLVLADMAFQMGEPRLRKFKRMIAACEKRDFSKMALEMQDSLWYSQTRMRAKSHIETIRGTK